MFYLGNEFYMSNFKRLIFFGLCAIIVLIVILILINHQTVKNEAQVNKDESNLTLPILSNQGFSKFVTNQVLINPKDQLKPKAMNNDFGISLPVLEYLQEVIPSDNLPAIYAALRYAQIQEQLYNAANEQDATRYAIEQNIPLNCMVDALGFNQTRQITEHMNDLRHATESGVIQMERVESFLAYKFIGSNLTTKQIKSRCQEGNY